MSRSKQYPSQYGESIEERRAYWETLSKPKPRSKEDSARYWATQKAKPGFLEQRREYSRQRHNAHGAILARIKDVPCMDCGRRFHHSAMEFDHRPGEDKLMGIGRMKANKLSSLLAEIEKCDIVCANCHAFRTWKRVQQAKEDRLKKRVNG